MIEPEKQLDMFNDRIEIYWSKHFGLQKVPDRKTKMKNVLKQLNKKNYERKKK